MPDPAGEPHQAEILVEWWPSASIGEPEAVRHLLEGWCGQLMERLQALGVVDPCVELDMGGARPEVLDYRTPPVSVKRYKLVPAEEPDPAPALKETR